MKSLNACTAPAPAHSGSGLPCPPVGPVRPESDADLWAASAEQPSSLGETPNLAKLKREAPAKKSSPRRSVGLAPRLGPGPRAETAPRRAAPTCNFGGLLKLAEPPATPCWLVFQFGDLASGRLVRGGTVGAAAFSYAESVLDTGCTLLVMGARGELAALDVSVGPDRAVCVRPAEVAR